MIITEFRNVNGSLSRVIYHDQTHSFEVWSDNPKYPPMGNGSRFRGVNAESRAIESARQQAAIMSHQ